jgi:phosphoribosylanthranilate isomerase
MIHGIQVKVCGLTTPEDAAAAAAIGADYLGFIFHPQSPRRQSLAAFQAMAHRLPARKKVAVSVMPTPGELAGQRAAGFDFFQIHFPVGEGPALIPLWAAAIGSERLWLAPKLPSGTEPDPAWLTAADAMVWDGYAREVFGGSGRTADWSRFRRCREEQPHKTWILAGGLTPANIAAAIAATGAGFVDVNSGVELAPGVKDHAKLRDFALAIQGMA